MFSIFSCSILAFQALQASAARTENHCRENNPRPSCYCKKDPTPDIHDPPIFKGGFDLNHFWGGAANSLFLRANGKSDAEYGQDMENQKCKERTETRPFPANAVIMDQKASESWTADCGSYYNDYCKHLPKGDKKYSVAWVRKDVTIQECIPQRKKGGKYVIDACSPPSSGNDRTNDCGNLGKEIRTGTAVACGYVNPDGKSPMITHWVRLERNPPASSKPFPCPLCKKSFKTQKSLDDHTKAKHPSQDELDAKEILLKREEARVEASDATRKKLEKLANLKGQIAPCSFNWNGHSWSTRCYKDWELAKAMPKSRQSWPVDLKVPETTLIQKAVYLSMKHVVPAGNQWKKEDWEYLTNKCWDAMPADDSKEKPRCEALFTEVQNFDKKRRELYDALPSDIQEKLEDAAEKVGEIGETIYFPPCQSEGLLGYRYCYPNRVLEGNKYRVPNMYQATVQAANEEKMTYALKMNRSRTRMHPARLILDKAKKFMPVSVSAKRERNAAAVGLNPSN